MVDLATLAIKVDSSDVRDGVDELDKLSAAGNKAEKSVSSLGNETSKTGAKVGTASSAAQEYTDKILQQGSGLDALSGKTQGATGAIMGLQRGTVSTAAAIVGATAVTGLLGIAVGVASAAVDMLVESLFDSESELQKNADALGKVQMASDGVGAAQSAMGEMFDLATGKIKNNSAALRTNLELLAAQNLANAANARGIAAEAVNDSGEYSWGGLWRKNVPGRLAGVSRNTNARQRLQDVLDGSRSPDDVVRWASSQDFSNLNITRDEYINAVVRAASAPGMEDTASRIRSSLDNGVADPSFRTEPRVTRSRSTGGSGGSGSSRASAISDEQRAYDSALKSAQAYQDSLDVETSKIGKNIYEIKRMEVAAAAAAAQKAAALAPTTAQTEALRAEAFAILAAGEAWEQDTRSKAALDFQSNIIKPLEDEIALLGLTGAAREAAALELEKEGFMAKTAASGVTDVVAAWEQYFTAKSAVIEGKDIIAREAEAAQALTDSIREAAFAANEMGDALANAFGRGGGALADMISIVAEYRVRQDALAKEVAKGNKTQAQADAITKQQQLSNFTALTGAAKTFFKEGTTGYKALEAAEKALAVVQLINTARSVAAGAARMFEVLGPFGFPAVAAMLGVMASLGFSGGKGGSASVPTAEDIQAAQGTGSVLGDSKAKSDSITASLEIMSKNSNKDLEYSNSMVRSLRAIENNIGKLTSLLAKQLGVSGAFDTSGLGLGTTSGGLSGTLFGLAGGLPGLIASKLPIIGDIIGAVAKFVFSTKKTVTLIDQGLTFGAQTVADILENGLAGSTYQTVEIKKKKKLFGISISNSTSTSTATNPLGSEIGNQVSLIIGSLKDGILAAADILGVQGAAAALDAFSVNIGKISLKDLTADEIGKELEAVFSKLGDDMARAAIPGLDAFQKAGEGLFETLSRLAKDYITIDTTLQSIGRTFGAVGASSVAAREELIDLFGSLDDFVEQTAFFRENFLTEAQQIAPIATALSAELTRLGLTGVTTKDAFAQTVLGLDLTTTAGQEMYAALMAIAPAFAAVSDYTTKLNKTTADGLKSTIDQFGKFVESLTKYRDQLLQGELRVGNVYARARAQFLATSLLAASGDAGGLGSLEGVSKTFLAASRDNASTLTQYQRDVAAVVSAVDKGLFAATETVDYAQLQLAALDNSVALLTSIDANIAAIVPANQTPAPIAGTPPAGTATPDNGAMANELAQIRADQAAMAADMAKTNAAMLRFYNRWESDGLTVRTDPLQPLDVAIP